MRYGLALGSNLGDRLANLQRAVQHLLEQDIRLLAVAPIYETEPMDCPDDSLSFYNTVIEIESETEPLTLLAKLRGIEATLGRPHAHERNAPRTVDLDILYADALFMQHDDLTLPHPRMTQRRFVLEPLAEIRPELVLPSQQEKVASLLAKLPQGDPPLRLVVRDWLPEFAKSLGTR